MSQNVSVCDKQIITTLSVSKLSIEFRPMFFHLPCWWLDWWQIKQMQIKTVLITGSMYVRAQEFCPKSTLLINPVKPVWHVTVPLLIWNRSRHCRPHPADAGTIFAGQILGWSPPPKKIVLILMDQIFSRAFRIFIDIWGRIKI